LRWIGWILTVLLVLGWAASELPVAESSAPPPCQWAWRRTSDGWEQESAVVVRPIAQRPILHPAVVTALQVLVSLTALVGLSKEPTPDQ